MKQVKWNVYISYRPMVPDMPWDDGGAPKILGNLSVMGNQKFLAALTCGLVKFKLMPVEEALMFSLTLMDAVNESG